MENKPAANITVSQQNDNSTNPTASPQPKSTGGGAVPNLSGLLSGLTQAIQGTGSKPEGPVESSPVVNSTVWLEVAANAWALFQPGVGVDGNTGLPYAGGANFPDFTDWDLGLYIQTVMDAQKLGLISASGDWGGDARIQKVLTFLETRPLNETTQYPFWFYDATNGKDDTANSDQATSVVDIVDTGVLFVALNNLRNFNSAYAMQVDNIVLNGATDPNGGSNYAALLPDVENSASSNSIYSYLVTSGFASFWPQVVYVPNQILNNIVNTPYVTSPYGNASLPGASVTCDPLLLSVFELNNNDSRLMNYMNQVYNAQEQYWAATGQFAAFSEGGSNGYGYIYEWVVAPTGSMWKVSNEDQNKYYSMPPIIYTKVAFGFLALYNSTYARSMVIFLEQELPTPTNGYTGGSNNAGEILTSVDPNTNGMIIQAALYVIQE